MLKNCGCIKRKRRYSRNEDSSSCRSSEIERNANESSTSNERESGSGRSLLKIFTSSGCFRAIRKPGRAMSMTKVERGKTDTIQYIFKLYKLSTYFL